MIIVDIRDAIVLGNGLNCYTSDTSGSTVASFTVGCKEYDARYEKNTRYNNYRISVPSEMVEHVKRMKLQKGSMVHLLATMDLSLKQKSNRGIPSQNLMAEVVQFKDLFFGSCILSMPVQPEDHTLK